MSSFVNLLDVIYPIGSAYLSFDSTSPASKVGGTWSQITNRFLYCTTSSGSTGGANSVTLTVDQIPSHRHNTNMRINWFNTSGAGAEASWSSSTTLCVDREDVYTKYTGGGKSFNNMPAYVTVYCWRRTA